MMGDQVSGVWIFRREEFVGRFSAKTAAARAGFHRRENPSCRLDHGEMIAHHARGAIQARLHVGAGEPGILLQHILDRIAGGEKFQHRLHRDARAANDQPAIANIRFD
jgi:hypothetical protein